MTLGAITGGEVNEVVSEIGLTVLSRDVWRTSPNVNITANYSGGSTSLTSSISDVIGEDDTFYHFVAPTGESITNLVFDNTSGGGNANQNRIPVDDLAFITSVPEPCSVLLLGLGTFCGLIRRRGGLLTQSHLDTIVMEPRSRSQLDCSHSLCKKTKG